MEVLKGGAMEVIFKSGEKGNVEKDDLNFLINSKLITSFKRSSGWVEVESEETRKKIDLSFHGQERRSHF